MIDTGAGVVDADYRGVVFVLLFNHSDTDFEGMRSSLSPSVSHNDAMSVQEGDRVAQLILERIFTPDVVEVQVG
jgi:dUTP pyrophosphatase